MKKINLEICRALFNRARGDLGFITTVLSFLIANKVGVDIKWWYILLIGLYFIAHTIWSHLRGIRQSGDYARAQSRLFMELFNDVKEIKKKLNEHSQKI